MMAPMARAATTSDVFNAIAEPQRREILVLLRAGERPVTELAQELGMTQPGASKHLRVLREVGLVRDRKAGKQRLYGLDARGLRPVHDGRRVRAVLERELRPAGRVRAGPQAAKAGGVTYGSDRTGGAASQRRPRIALLHGESRGDPDAFESVLTFAPDGAVTRIEMHTVFPTKELREEAVEKYHAIEGGQQTLSNLAAYVTEIVRKEVES